MTDNANDSNNDPNVKERLCGSRRETIDGEMDRVDVKAEGNKSVINEIGAVLDGGPDTVGQFERVRNLEKRFDASDKEKEKTKNRIKWALFILLSLTGICRIGIGVSPTFRRKAVKIVKIIFATEEAEQEKRDEIRKIVIDFLQEETE